MLLLVGVMPTHPTQLLHTLSHLPGALAVQAVQPQEHRPLPRLPLRCGRGRPHHLPGVRAWRLLGGTGADLRAVGGGRCALLCQADPGGPRLPTCQRVS